jgi:hypothetical protein
MAAENALEALGRAKWPDIGQRCDGDFQQVIEQHGFNSRHQLSDAGGMKTSVQGRAGFMA